MIIARNVDGNSYGCRSFEARQKDMAASKYDQLRRDIIINADIYGGQAKPEILGAGYGFEGILGIPGLQTADDIEKAYAAGAGVVSSLLDLDDVPLRNITSGTSNIGLVASGYSNAPIAESYMDAMPIEFSHPILPSSVDPNNFELELNTGRKVNPLYAALNPNYEFNERQTVVVTGYFGNRLGSDAVGAEYPVKLTIVESSNPLKLVTPAGLFEATGLSKESNNPYDTYNGPSLVGAKLSKLSLAGDYAPDGFDNAVKNHGVEYYGNNKKFYRLRLFTSGGFSPDGVSGFLPDQFSQYFQINAKKADGSLQKISSANKRYEVNGGTVKVLGIADLGQGKDVESDYLYSEDHDNQFDIIIKASSRKAAASLKNVILPDPRLGTHSPIYNPGGPGSSSDRSTTFTEPNGGQVISIENAVKASNTVSWASQNLEDYDSSDLFAVAFRLRDPISGATLLTASSIEASDAIEKGFEFADVPFSVNSTDSFSKDIYELSNSQTGDLFYTSKQKLIDQFQALGYQNNGTSFKAYPKKFRGLSPVYQLRSESGMHTTVIGENEKSDLLDLGWEKAGKAFYAVAFDNL